MHNVVRVQTTTLSSPEPTQLPKLRQWIETAFWVLILNINGFSEPELN